MKIDLSKLDLSYHFDKNLRDVPNTPVDMTAACHELQRTAESASDPSQKAQLLAQLGSYQRMLNDLVRAEQAFSESLQLLEQSNASPRRLTAARIRLAHVFQWQKRFVESGQILKSCIEASRSFDDQGEMLSFALQHMGKNLFDQSKYDEAQRCFYDAMMIRVRLEKQDLADSSRLALDRTMELLVPPLSSEVIDRILFNPRLPEFVRKVHGKRHDSGPLPRERSNCINAVINFFSSPPYRFETASTLDALALLQNDFTQFDESHELCDADVVVFWSRLEQGAWHDRKIRVREMNISSPDFPYGLIFEHIAVVIDAESEIIFHKPSPALEVPYKIESLNAAVSTLKYSRGYEATWHRRNTRS